MQRETRVYMDTPVTIAVVRPGPEADGAAVLDRAFAWFREVEAQCNRFDPDSDLRRLAQRPGQAVAVPALLFEAVRFALRVARASRGAFDPTIGREQEMRGFDRDYRVGRSTSSNLDPGGDPPVWRDLRLDPRRRTITALRPVLLDLGGVAKGLAIDLAAKELAGYAGCVVEAGGDLLACGRNPDGEPWRIGIRHPRRPEAVCTVLRVSDRAVCTSGDYERRSAVDGGAHLFDPRSRRPARGSASCSVVAATAMLADALSTAACVMGAGRGVEWLQRQGVEGLYVADDLQRFETAGFARYEACQP